LAQGFSTGLAKALVENKQNFHHRVWVVDNSGSMQIGDGHRVNNGKVLSVTRWAEIQDTVLYHSQMAAVLNSFTRFRLLNYPGQEIGQQEFTVGGQGADVDNDIQNARMVMTRTKPDGVTPLTEHIWEIAAEVRQLLPQLQQSGKRVGRMVIVDGILDTHLLFHIQVVLNHECPSYIRLLSSWRQMACQQTPRDMEVMRLQTNSYGR
jgi:hypothetical protein